MYMRKSYFLIILSLLLCSCSFAKKDDKMMASKDIVKLIDKAKDVVIFDKIITDDLDFSNIENQIIDGNANVNHTVTKDIVFIKCVFLGKVFASKKETTSHKTLFAGNVTFRTCDFRGELDLSNVVVNGCLSFAQSTFRENASFNGLQVKGNSSHFWDINAEKDFSMVKSSTVGSLNFMDAHFAGACMLQGTDCNTLQFSNVQCDSTLDFSTSSFRNSLFMNYGTFNGAVNFSKCQMSSSDIMNCQFLDNIDFSNSIILGLLRFNGSKFKGEVVCNKSFFLVQPSTEGIETSKPFKINVVNYSQLEIK